MSGFRTPGLQSPKCSGSGGLRASFPFPKVTLVAFPMFMFPVAVLSQYIFGITLFLLSSFLILLILVQQGRGGGLAGALGGPGGQSAFGTKAGDIFTRVTIIVASVWIVLSAVAVYFFNEPSAGSALSNTTINTTSTSNPGDVNPGMGSLPNTGAMAPLAPGAGSTTPTLPTTPSNTSAEVGSSNEAPLTFEPTPPAAEAKPSDSNPTTAPVAAEPATPTTSEPSTTTEPASTPANETPASEPAAAEPAADSAPSEPTAEQPASDSAPQPQP